MSVARSASLRPARRTTLCVHADRTRTVNGDAGRDAGLEVAHDVAHGAGHGAGHGAEPEAGQHDPNVPAGWSYNPASWGQRLPLVGLAVLGACIAGYLALYQYGVVDHVWEPFFGSGSRRILHSSISFTLPVSDATLGALGYVGDAVAGVIGGRARWRTMPWIVLLFGVLVGPLGAISIALVIAQPIAYHAFCTLCLTTALISTLMIGPAMDEVLASLQYLRRVARTPGRSVWRTFWGLESRPTPSARADNV